MQPENKNESGLQKNVSGEMNCDDIDEQLD